jgi:hypothetical protein
MLTPNTLDTLRAFLGPTWKEYKVRAALDALALIQESVAKANNDQ